MITVTWNLVSGAQGAVELEGDQKWTFGRAGAADGQYFLGVDDPNVSRSSLIIRDSAPGPVVFRGQRDNGAQVGVLTDAGQTIWLEEGTACNLTADARRIEFYSGDELLLTIAVDFDARASVVDRQHGS